MQLITESPEMAWLGAIGFLVAFLASALIVLTRSWHGTVTFDTSTGPQKLHDAPTPRIGGVAVFAALWCASAAAPPPIRDLLFTLGASGTAVFVIGLAEDLTKGVPPGWRLSAALFSGLLFCIMSGYSVTRVDIAFIDGYLELDVVSFALTALMMAALCNGMNMIDGLNGLAPGAGIIMSAAVAVVAWLAGDSELMWLAIIISAVMAGFLAMNFPFGYVFLGDSGAYFTGFMLGALAIMLPVRNPEISPWASVVILAYPVLEVTHATLRKLLRNGYRPFEPDAVHLHMLLHRSFGRWVVKAARNPRLANPATGALLWVGPMTGLLFVVLLPPVRDWALLAIFLQFVLYFTVYRRVALLRRNSVLSIPRRSRGGGGGGGGGGSFRRASRTGVEAHAQQESR